MHIVVPKAPAVVVICVIVSKPVASFAVSFIMGSSSLLPTLIIDAKRMACD
jgi:hypothetical protein